MCVHTDPYIAADHKRALLQCHCRLRCGEDGPLDATLDMYTWIPCLLKFLIIRYMAWRLLRPLHLSADKHGK
jgi:hypothetical protein